MRRVCVKGMEMFDYSKIADRCSLGETATRNERVFSAKYDLCAGRRSILEGISWGTPFRR